jgi:large subunit ribosomal protein L1
VRNRLRLPHAVRTDLRICVIADPDSPAAAAARDAGASLVGTTEVFDAVKAGIIEFDACIAHPDALPLLNKAGVARVLGPRGLMPSAKARTVVADVAAAVNELKGASEYRERMGVVRMAIGQLGFTPVQMSTNIKAFLEAVRKDMNMLSEKISKEVHEVVLSSTHAPGFSLNGLFKADQGVQPEELVVER